MPRRSPDLRRSSSLTPDGPRAWPKWQWSFLVPLLLAPAILVPAVAPDPAPTTIRVDVPARLSASSGSVPGGDLFIAGSGFAQEASLALLWDGAETDWLPAVVTDQEGAFTVEASLPEDVEPGRHELLARVAEAAASDEGEVRTAVRIDTAPVAVEPPAPVRIWYEPSGLITPPKRPVAEATEQEEPVAVATPAPQAPAPTPPPTVAVAPPVVGVAGYGAGTQGGTGGTVIEVTTLNDSGPGSLRAAIDASGPRTVVFRVGGTINLGNDLRVANPFITIDGSTAPGPVVVRGGMLVIASHDVIVRQLRFRPGDQVGSPSEVDAVSLIGLRNEVYNVVLDHLSMVWGPDIGGLSMLGNVHDVTVQYSIMGEGLYRSSHPEAGDNDGHSMGTSVFQLDPGVAWGKRITFHHNLFTTAATGCRSSRAPSASTWSTTSSTTGASAA